MAGNPLTFYGRRKSRWLALLCFKQTVLQRNLVLSSVSSDLVASNQRSDSLPLSDSIIVFPYLISLNQCK